MNRARQVDRRVTFANDLECIILLSENYWTRHARRQVWTRHAADRQRFERRIVQCEEILCNIYSAKHKKEKQ